MLPDLDAINLVPAHMALSFLGFCLTMYLMALAHRGAIGVNDNDCVRFFRRLSMSVIAGAMLWSTAYGYNRDWQPWPPFLLMCFGVDMMFLNAIVSAYWSQRKTISEHPSVG